MLKTKLNEDTVKFKVWYKWFGEKGYEYVYADGPYEAEYKFIEKERYKDHPKELLRVETPGTIITRKKESKQYRSSNIGKKMENVVPIGKDEVQQEFISLLPDDIAWGYTHTDNGPTVFMSLNPDKYPNDERTVVMYVQGYDATNPALVTRVYTDDSDKRGHWGKMFEFNYNPENPWKQCADYVSSLLLDGVTESKKFEADYSTSRVSKPIADAYSLLDGYFCDENGRLTDDAVDRIFITFRNEKDLVDRCKSKATKSHSIAWDALLREIQATLEWDDEFPHATKLSSEQVKNWFKLKGRDYKEELKPLVAVIDAYRNKEY